MTLAKIYKKYPTEDKFIKHLELILWDNTPRCPYCGTTYNSPAPKENRYHCNNCNTSFSVTTATIFHKTRVDLRKWVFAIKSVLQNENLTVRNLGELLGVTKDTAGFMLKRIKPELINNRNKLEKISLL